jgi:hypothetical protein
MGVAACQLCPGVSLTRFSPFSSGSLLARRALTGLPSYGAFRLSSR